MKVKNLPVISALVLVIVMATQSAITYYHIKANLENHIKNRIKSAQKSIVPEVFQMYEATEEIVDFYPEAHSNPKDLMLMVKTILVRYPNLYGCYVTFAPEHSPKKGKWYVPYAYRLRNNTIRTADIGNKVKFLEREWYTRALQSNDDGYWSQPYNDGIHEGLVFTHSRKVYDNGKMVGVAGADCTLEIAKRLLESIKPYDDAVCLLYSSKGTLIAKSSDDDMDGMIVMEGTLSPTNMRIVTGVPKSHVLTAVRGITLQTLAVLLIGIVIAGWLIRRIWRDQEEYARIDTAKRLIDKELQIASNIQKGILRGKGIEAHLGAEEMKVQATLVPMHEVGGDLYDYCRKGEDLFFIIGDVSGKGIPAAMFMSATVNLFRSAVQRHQSPKAIIEEMNSVLSEHNPSLMFVTVFIGRLHIPTGLLLYCNASHLPPLVVNHRCLREIEIEPNIPLGYERTFRFVEQGTKLGQGDTMILYTDGVTEARNNKREMLGKKRWKEIVEGTEILPGTSMPIDSLLTNVHSFIGTAEQADDITLLTISWLSETQPFTLRVPNKVDQWPVLRTALNNYGLCVGLDQRMLKKMIVAFEEAVVNIIQYSKASYILLTITHPPLTITLTDNGVAFDPTAQAETDTPLAISERQIGGLGIVLLRQIADKIDYRRTDGQNELTITKNI